MHRFNISYYSLTKSHVSHWSLCEQRQGLNSSAAGGSNQHMALHVSAFSIGHQLWFLSRSNVWIMFLHHRIFKGEENRVKYSHTRRLRAWILTVKGLKLVLFDLQFRVHIFCLLSVFDSFNTGFYEHIAKNTAHSLSFWLYWCDYHLCLYQIQLEGKIKCRVRGSKYLLMYTSCSISDISIALELYIGISSHLLRLSPIFSVLLALFCSPPTTERNVLPYNCIVVWSLTLPSVEQATYGEFF